MQRNALVETLDTLLQSDQFKDYGPNGLQVEGKAEVRKLVTGVTASLSCIEAAIEQQADALLVHHGLFWRGQTGALTGWMRQRVGLLIAHNINLIAYHLPLDAHPVWGNNAQLAQQLGLVTEKQIGEQGLLSVGRVQAKGRTAWPNTAALAQHIEAQLGRSVTWVEGEQRPIHQVAWCTGGGQSFFEQAISAGVDAFITGEISEPQAHYARECGVAFLACGHHATERYGIQALGHWLMQTHGLDVQFIDIPNPA